MVKPTRRSVLVCGVLLLSVINASWTLSSRPLNNHECYVSVTAREMLESGNWVMPTFNGEYRLQKTPLSYWLVACVALVTGRVDEFAARLPSAVFAVLSVGAILYFVSRWLSFRIALLAAVVWATSLAHIRYAHNARPEMVMTFFILLCYLTFYSALPLGPGGGEQNRKRQIAYMLVFWASFGLANLAKGPAPLPLVLVPLFVYVLVFKQWRKIPKLLPVAGPLVFLAIVLPWPLAIAHQANWDLTLWKHEFVDRFFGEYASGDKPLYYYLPKMFMFMVPWVAFVPMALAAPFYKVWSNKRAVMWFLWVWLVAGVIFLTISGGKRQHYILPFMPPMAVLIGILVEDMVFVKKAFTAKFAKDVLRWHIAALLLGVAALPAYFAFAERQFLAGAVITSAVMGVLAIAVIVLFAKRRPAAGISAVFAGIVLLVMIAYVFFINPSNYNEPSRQFTLEVAKMVGANDKLVAYKVVSARFIHYFGRPVQTAEELSQLDTVYKQDYWVVAFGQPMTELLETGGYNLIYRESGAERHGSEPVDGALFHKPAPETGARPSAPGSRITAELSA